jgi:hypothetical protein
MKLNKKEFKSYFEFERPDNTLMSYLGVGIEYLIFPLVFVVALLDSLEIEEKK